MFFPIGEYFPNQKIHSTADTSGGKVIPFWLKSAYRAHTKGVRRFTKPTLAN
jgi:hypothetical protein